MKIIILFALASVSVCTESGSSTCEPYVPTFDRCDDFVNEYANDDNCLRHALESVPKLLETGKKLICKGRKNKLDKRFEYYEAFEKELRDFLGCTGCFVDKILGAEEILGHVGAAVGSVVGMSVEIIGEIIHSTGLNPALDLLCDVLTGELMSKCAEMLSNSDLTSNTGSLRLTSISSVVLDLEELIKILKTFGCVRDNSLGIKDTLSDLTSKTGSLGSISSVATIDTLVLELLKILEDVGCLLDDLVGIKDTLSDLTSKTGSLGSISSVATIDTLVLELLKILEVAGCVLDDLVGIKDTLKSRLIRPGNIFPVFNSPILSDPTSKTGSLGSISSVATIDTLVLELRKILEVAGCILDDLVGIKDTLSDLTSKTGSLGSISSVAQKETLVLERLKILNLEKIIKILKTVGCVMDNSLGIKDTLKTVGCVLDNSLGIKDTLTNVTPDIGEALHSLIKPLLDAVLEIPGIGDLIGGITCTW